MFSASGGVLTAKTWPFSGGVRVVLALHSFENARVHPPFRHLCGQNTTFGLPISPMADATNLHNHSNFYGVSQ